MARIQAFKCLDKSDGANATGTAMDIRGMTAFGFEVAASGTLEGSVQLEGSVSGDRWANYGAAQTVAAGGTVVFDQNAMGSGWADVGVCFIRPKWTKSGGTGGVVGYSSAKGIC